MSQEPITVLGSVASISNVKDPAICPASVETRQVEKKPSMSFVLLPESKNFVALD